MFTIHCAVNEKFLPLLYAILPNKQEATYTKFFKMIRNYINAPSGIISDFEIAIINSINECYPNTSVYGKILDFF